MSDSGGLKNKITEHAGDSEDMIFACTESLQVKIISRPGSSEDKIISRARGPRDQIFVRAEDSEVTI